MKQIDTSTYNFPEIIANDFLYVDKTEFIWKLVSKKKGEYFLSRPRRFGKSLLISTLKAFFQGRRELFKGLAIDKEDYDWKAYPVIHLDFGACVAATSDELATFLQFRLEESAAEHGVELTAPTPQECFIELVKKLAKKGRKQDTDGRVVVLVDEYDKPILSNVTNPNVSEILKLLKGFYGVIKTYEGLIRFAFITGVSKFAHVSIFSDLNNLTDITLHSDYAGMLGFTEAEIREYFADRIPLAARANGKSDEELMQWLLKWYDGYRFSNADTHVCNPVSIATFFSNNYEFANYWGKTGMPSFLLELAKTTRFNFERAITEPVSELAFGAYELDNLDTLGLLWQTGYLTIAETIPSPFGDTMYRLGFPDLEVEHSFNTQLLAYYSGMKDAAMSSIVYKLTETLRRDDVNVFMKTLQAYFASIPYEIHSGDERYYQTIFFITFLLLGTAIEAESKTNDGSIDAYIRTAKAVYIFEFKLNKTVRKAIAQIKDKHYYEKFQGGELPIYLIGANFNSTKGQLNNWAYTTVSD